MDRTCPEIRLDSQLAGGSLNDVGRYPVGVLVTRFGRQPGAIHAMAARTEAQVDTPPAAVRDFDGPISTISRGYEGPLGDRPGIVGRDSSILLSKACEPLPHETAYVTVSSRATRRHVIPYQTDQFADGIVAFARALEHHDGGGQVVNATDVRYSSATREATHRAAQIRVNPNACHPN